MSLTPCLESFQEFVKERQFITNVSDATVEWYWASWKTWERFGPGPKEFVIRAREAGMGASTINTYARAMNAYFRWAGLLDQIPKLKTEQKVMAVFSGGDIQKFLRFKPKTFEQTRLHTLVLLILDCGLRISEALGVRWADIDFDNLLMTVNGKGRKQRKVPFSFEMRKQLWRFHNAHHVGELVFCTRHGSSPDRHDMLRDFKLLCRKLAIVPPERAIHALRHTFAVNYLRRGGSVFHLQKILGHSTLEMTRRYANLCTEDLQQVHEKLSLLAAMSHAPAAPPATGSERSR